MSKFHVPYMYNPGVLAGKLPDKLFKKVKKAVLDPKARSASVRHLLVGAIKNEFSTPEIPELRQYVSEMYEEWCETFQTEKSKYVINPVWTNYMKAGEFNPNHTHPTAIAAFVIWVQIPYDIQEEIKGDEYNNAKHPNRASCFEFTYSLLDGRIHHNPIYIDKNYEGTIAMFPGTMIHCVYPFRTSDGERITIAGNIHMAQNAEVAQR